MRYASLFAIVLIAAPAFAVTAPAWTIDRTKSQVAFAASMNGQAINGRFRRFDARVAFDPTNLAGSRVTAVIDIASATTGDTSRDQSLPTPDWFNIKAFPRATFMSKAFKSLGGNRYQAAGTLTIRGVARPVVLPFQLVTNGTVAQMRGTLTIDRRLFGVGQGQFASADTVAAAVKVNIALIAHKAS
jgi:polyisoprenoid-binding protein YceI